MRGPLRLPLLLALAAACYDRGHLLGIVPGDGGATDAAGVGGAPGEAGVPGAARPFACSGLSTAERTGGTVAFPAYLASVTDPAYGTQLTRITGDKGTPLPRIGGTWAGRTRSVAWSKQVWNADESLLWLNFGGSLVLDGNTYEVIGRVNLPSVPTWDPANPELMVYVDGNSVKRWNARTLESTTVATFPGYSRFRQDSARDHLSADGTRTAVVATRASDGLEVAFAVDLNARTKLADIVLRDQGFDDEPRARISLSGRYLVLAGSATRGGRAIPVVFVVYDLDGNRLRERAEFGCPHVGDSGLDAAGDDGEVGRCDTGPMSGQTVFWRYRDGATLAGGASSVHTSARALRRPGWVFASGIRSPLIYATRVDDARTEYIADARTLQPLSYWAEPHAIPSPSGTRLVFATNWGAGDPGDDDAHSFVADFRALCPR